MWIWCWDDEEDQDERKANDTPATPESVELKWLFEDAVGQHSLKYSYEPHYRLARKLFEFALHGTHTNDAMNEADNLIREWSTLRDPEMRLIEAPGDLVDETADQEADTSQVSIHERDREATVDLVSESVEI